MILNNYFKLHPYSDWFDWLNLFLMGMDCGYYTDIKPNTALHTDICTPLATSPTWSEFKQTKLSIEIQNEGILIWHRLLTILKPRVVLMSFSKDILKRIQYIDLSDRQIFYQFDKKENGQYRKKPYLIELYSTIINGYNVNFLFGEGNVRPFFLTELQRYQLGKEVKALF